MFESVFNRSGLSLDRLLNFCAVAEKGSIASVAPGDSARQSLISRQIGELEEFFGVELVRRQGRGLALTEEGRELAALAKDHFKGLADFSNRQSGRSWTVQLVAPNSVTQWALLPQMASLKEQFPKTRWQIHHAQTSEMISGLREGHYDLAILRKDAVPEDLASKGWGRMKFSFLLPKTLVSKRARSLGDALTSSPVALPIGGTLRQSVESLVPHSAQKIDIRFACSSYLQAWQLAQAGVCGAVLPSFGDKQRKQEGFYTWSVPYQFPLSLAWTRRNARVRSQLDTLIDSIGKLAPGN